MTNKVAYLWGPISSFAAPLIALLLKKGWHVHIACKPSLNVFSLSPLDLRSSIEFTIEEALGGREKLKPFHDRIRIIDPSDAGRGTKYDALIFTGLPPNFDEPRAPRAPWAADELKSVARSVKGTPAFIVSSIWGGIQEDGTVPEELEFDRRKPQSRWEGVCQLYESKLLACLEGFESPWYLVRLPMLLGSSENGETTSFTGPYSLLKEISKPSIQNKQSKPLQLAFDPDATLWVMPQDIAMYMFWRFMEDENRPRICNLVPTQSILNREWLQHLAEAAGYEEVTQIDWDPHTLPGTLRRMLKDNLHIRTRNLFEMTSRYRVPPVILDKQYFSNLLRVAQKENWGNRPMALPSIPSPKILHYSEKLAECYFEKFLPTLLKTSSLEQAIAGGASIGFRLKGVSDRGWVIRPTTDGASVERLASGQDRPGICFRFTGDTLTQLIQRKLPLHRALLTRSVEIEGSISDGLRISNCLDRFFKENPFTAQEYRILNGES